MAQTPLRLATVFTSLALLLLANGFEPTEDGLYAVFDTSEGEFTAQLYFEQVPITVASFVGLAEGSLPHYVQESESLTTERFYDGITFHRVVENFVIQAGSPNGLGNDGPGYVFADEIETELKHDAKGILSMANAGPNTNGSQFFITLSSQTARSLDGRHAVFGLIVDGIEVVDTIGLVETDIDAKPTTPVTINSVTILRVGPDATLFRSSDYFRPFELTEKPTITIDPGHSAYVSFPRLESSTYLQYKTLDFQQIEGPIELSGSESNPEIIRHKIDLPENTTSPVFYYYSEISGFSRPRAVAKPGYTLTFTLPGTYGLHTVSLQEDQIGKFTSGFNTEELDCEYGWYELDDHVQIYLFLPFPEFQNYYEVQIHLDRDNLNPETAVMNINDPFFQSFTHEGAFTFEPSP